ncbi:MAG: ABC transporter ATP-binding protein [Pseudomonadota bacterium]
MTKSDAQNPATMVEIDGVTKQFGSVTAVEDASFKLDRGAFLTIVGPSGCGKTTLLRMIAGFERPSAGRIALAGADVSSVPAHKRAIGMVFQRLALFPHMTAAQNIAYPLKRRGHGKSGIAARVEEMLSLVRLDGLSERRPHELSGGQQQRVAIARALSFKPDLLLLDEPLSALDKKLREDLQLEFRRIQQDLGVTTINVTHDQREALVMSDKIVVMDGGRIQQTDAPQALYGAPANRFVATFLGQTSLFPGTVTAAGPPLTITAHETTLSAKSPESLGVGAAVECTVRAEAVRLLKEGETADNTLEGTVTAAIFEGERIVYRTSCPSIAADLWAVSSARGPGQTHRPGDKVALGIDGEDVLVFPVHPDAALS